MYCTKCGTEKVNGKCPNCDSSKSLKDIAYNTYVFIGTIATLLIIRLTTQETRSVPTPNSWRNSYGTEFYVPGNIQGVMVVLLLVSAYVLFKMFNSGKYSKTNTVLMLLAEIFFGVLITFVKF